MVGVAGDQATGPLVDRVRPVTIFPIPEVPLRAQETRHRQKASWPASACINPCRATARTPTAT